MSILSLVSRDIQNRRFTAQSTADADDSGPQGVSKYLQSLAIHIPAEIIGIYVFGLSIVGAVSQEFHWANNLTLYAVCIFLTPVFALIAVRTRGASAGSLPSRQLAWVIIAPTVAFVFWGLAIPENPLVETEGAHLLAGFAAVVVSALLDSLKKVIYPAASVSGAS